MNSKKKTVAVAMATALGVSGMMSPVAVYAQEKLVNGQKRIEESQIKQNASQQPITIDNGGTPISGDININETNFPDKEFRDWIKTHIIGADNDVLTPDEISNITRIDVSNESEIKNLKGIEHFTALKGLYCHNTGITTLDVSNNKQLIDLYCTNTPLAFLKLGSLNASNTFIVPSSTTASLTVASASFDITQAFAGIDTTKISNIQGAELDGNTVKGYSVGTPITYTYNCGTNNGIPVKLDVTLNLSISKKSSTIAITGSLDTTYTGKPIEKPTISKTGSTGDVTFAYQVKNGDTWETYNDTPINAGIYRVTAHLTEDDFYKDAETTKEYTISPKDIKDGNITVSNISNDSDVEKLIVKDDDKVLVKGTDYDVETKMDGSKTTVTITFKGNYVGTIEKNYTVKQEQKPQDKPKDTGSVKTSDSTQTGLLAMLSMMSAGCIALLAGKKRKKNMKEDETTPL